VTIPDSVTNIGLYAFSETGLTNVTIPGSVTSIESDGFFGCTNLSSVTISNGVTSIGDYAFSGLASLKSVTMPDSVTNIGENAFEGCVGLTSVTIPGSVTSLGFGVFSHCTNLSNVTISNGVASLGGDAFAYCDLASVEIPASTTNIGGAMGSYGQGAFYDCPRLTAITVAAENAFYSSINGVLFNSNQTALVEFPGGLLRNYTIPNGVTSIGEYAFQNSGLTSVAISGTVTNIGNFAFYGCTNLTSVTISNGVTSIGGSAFDYCTSLTSIEIPASVTNVIGAVFGYCTSLTAITAAPQNPVYSSINGVLFNSNQTTLVEFPGGLLGNHTIPNGVTSIGEYAFEGCIGLANVTIPGSVTNIGDFSFQNCTNLTSVFFKGDAPTVGLAVFSFDRNVAVYYLPDTTGWAAAVDLRPTLLWNPLIITGDGSFGLLNNQFGFNITGTNIPVVVEACTNLANPVWIPVSTNTLTGGTSYFSDPQWTNYPGRFYRVQLSP
jgi:hypothetical protein